MYTEDTKKARVSGAVSGKRRIGQMQQRDKLPVPSCHEEIARKQACNSHTGYSTNSRNVQTYHVKGSIETGTRKCKKVGVLQSRKLNYKNGFSQNHHAHFKTHHHVHITTKTKPFLCTRYWSIGSAPAILVS